MSIKSKDFSFCIQKVGNCTRGNCQGGGGGLSTVNCPGGNCPRGKCPRNVKKALNLAQAHITESENETKNSMKLMSLKLMHPEIKVSKINAARN